MNNTIKDVLWVFLRNISNQIIALVNIIIISRILGPQLYGAYVSIALFAATMVVLFGLGIGSSTIYYMGNDITSKSKAILNGFVLTVFIAVVSIIVSSLTYIEYCHFQDLLKYKNLILLSLLLIPFQLANTFLYSVNEGIGDFKSNTIISNIQSIANLVFVVFLLFNQSLIIPISGLIISNIITFILLIKKNYIYLYSQIDLIYMKKVLKFALKDYLINIVGYFNYKIDLFIVGALAGSYSLGLYSISSSIAEKIWIVSSSVCSVLFQRISASDNKSKSSELTKIALAITIISTGVICLLIYLTADILIPLVFGKEYLNAVVPLKILLIGVLMMTLYKILGSSLAGHGRPGIVAIISMCAVLVNIGLNFILIPIYNIDGAAYASLISYSVAGLLSLICYWKLIDRSIVHFYNYPSYKTIFLSIRGDKGGI